MSVYGISVKNNPEQQEFVRLIEDNQHAIVFCTGYAGTGKTFTALATALDLKEKQKKYKHIIYVRDPVPVGHDIGALPGTADEKMSPYWGPVLDTLEAIAKCQSKEEKDNINNMRSKIEVVPMAFLRGRSFVDSIIILDEAESCDLTALKTALSRVNEYSKIIILGSYNQVDDWRQRKEAQSDFERVIEKLKGHPKVACIELERSMRASWTVEIDKILGELEDRV